jgi:hypothetical protein
MMLSREQFFCVADITAISKEERALSTVTQLAGRVTRGPDERGRIQGAAQDDAHRLQRTGIIAVHC